MTNSSRTNYTECNDRELWNLWCAGDLRAGSRFCDRYAFQVYRFLASKLKDDRDVEDLTQRTFLELTTMVGKTQPDKPQPQQLRAYIFGIARHVLIAHYGRKTRLALTAVPDATIEQMAPGPGLSTILGQSNERAQLARALQQLPLDSQIVLELYFWEELTGTEIAEVLKIPEPTLRGRLRRAKELLAERLQTPVDDDVEQRIRGLSAWVEHLKHTPRS